MAATTIPARVVDFEEWSKMPRVRDLERPPRVHDLVVIRSRGAMRLARVTKVGRVRLATEYVTEAALDHQRRYGHLTVTRKSVPMDDDNLRYAGSRS